MAVKTKTESRVQTVRRLQAGLRFGAIEQLRTWLDLSLEEICVIVRISPRTLARRKREGRFSLDESERIHRVGSLFHLSQAVQWRRCSSKVLSNCSKATRRPPADGWLRRDQKARLRRQVGASVCANRSGSARGRRHHRAHRIRGHFLTITAWRICKRKFAKTMWTGIGSRAVAGRWNGRNVPVVYASGSISLAAIELLVHLDSAELLARFIKCPVSCDSRLVKRLGASFRLSRLIRGLRDENSLPRHRPGDLVDLQLHHRHRAQRWRLNACRLHVSGFSKA